jgi:hypothetical protein
MKYGNWHYTIWPSFIAKSAAPVIIALGQDGKLNVMVRGKSFALLAVEPNPWVQDNNRC